MKRKSLYSEEDTKKEPFLIIEQRLTDGSFVYDVIGYDSPETTQIKFNCESEAAARRLCEELNKAVGVTLKYTGRR